MEIRDSIREKYKHKDNAYPMIVLTDGREFTLNYFDYSGLFDYVKSGDIIKKDSGSLEFYVIRRLRNGEIYEKKFMAGCK
ncbi:MAG: hypothetical protein ABJG41_04005 [Cyclobacteriaceae bacterium]